MATKKTDSEKAQGFTALAKENIKPKQQVKALEAELEKAKAKANKKYF